MAYENFNKLIDYGINLQEANLFPIIAVSGALGLGKTSLSIQWAIRHNEKRFNDTYFSVRKYIAYDNDEVHQKYYTLPENSPLIADEAARFAMAQDWNKAVNKELKKTTMQLRPRHLLLFLNIPNFTWLDKVYREELVSLWIWIPTRSYAIAFRPDNNPKFKDRWRLKEFPEKDRIDSFTDINKVISIVQKHPCYFDVFKFPQVPQDIEDEYLELRMKKTFTEASERFVVQKDLAKVMAYNIYYKWNELVNAVESSRRNTPTFRVIENIMFDPVKKIRLVNHSNIEKWVKEIKNKVPPEIQEKLEVKDLPESKEEDKNGIQ